MLKRNPTARRVRHLCAALVAACVLSACQHLPSFDSPASKTTATQPAPKKQTRKKAAPAAATAPATAALRGQQPDAAQTEAVQQRGPAHAAALRATALDQLNTGAVDGAVTNLKAARELDPANTLIQRDLDRAMRIQATVSAQPK
ncbi:MAG: hypothetical protein SGI91_05670 [Alphaproteobacteria bacterium]|nr:hypothetical protein [Alphaproteobacteria bacterium]